MKKDRRHQRVFEFECQTGQLHYLCLRCMNLLEAKFQMATMRQGKTDAYNLAQSYFKYTRSPTVRELEA